MFFPVRKRRHAGSPGEETGDMSVDFESGRLGDLPHRHVRLYQQAHNALYAAAVNLRHGSAAEVFQKRILERATRETGNAH